MTAARAVGKYPLAVQRFDAYPHQMSGGMRQRVLIAMAIACQPGLLIADEPTTALDATIQARILELLGELTREANMGLLLITHNLGIVAGHCERVAAMYEGRIVETAPVRALFAHPHHRYTNGLLECVPRLDHQGRGVFHTIPRVPPDPSANPSGCPFHSCCAFAVTRCIGEQPQLNALSNRQRALPHRDSRLASPWLRPRRGLPLRRVEPRADGRGSSRRLRRSVRRQCPNGYVPVRVTYCPFRRTGRWAAGIE